MQQFHFTRLVSGDWFPGTFCLLVASTFLTFLKDVNHVEKQSKNKRRFFFWAEMIVPSSTSLFGNDRHRFCLCFSLGVFLLFFLNIGFLRTTRDGNGHIYLTWVSFGSKTAPTISVTTITLDSTHHMWTMGSLVFPLAWFWNAICYFLLSISYTHFLT